MKRAQLRADFVKAFGLSLDMSYDYDAGRFFYIDPITQASWLAWVSAFETYSTDQLTGGYDDAI